MNDLKISIKELNKRTKSKQKYSDLSLNNHSTISKQRLKSKLKSLGSYPDINELKQILKKEWVKLKKKGKLRL